MSVQCKTDPQANCSVRGLHKWRMGTRHTILWGVGRRQRRNVIEIYAIHLLCLFCWQSLQAKKKGRKRSGPEKCRGKSKEKINEFFLAVLLSSPKPLPTLERDRLFGEGGGQTTTPLHKRDRTPNSQIPSHNFCEMQITPKCVCQI